MLPWISMARAQVNGIQLHYLDSGTGQPVVFVHGNVASTRWWLPTLERLPNTYRGIAVDLRGYGLSDKPGIGYGIEQHARDLQALLQQLDIPRAHIVGHSLGAAVALEYAIRFPGAARTITLLDSAPPSGLRIDITSYSAVGWLLGNRTLFERALRSTVPTGPTDDFWTRIVDDALLVDPTAWSESFRSLNHWNAEREASKLRLPTLIVHGANDVLVPVESAHRTAQTLVGAKLTILKGVGHSPQLERPDEWTRLLVHFLKTYS
ncbi:MAG: alpha/beta fold hydrolase [Herpetosiphon sp.]